MYDITCWDDILDSTCLAVRHIIILSLARLKLLQFSSQSFRKQVICLFQDSNGGDTFRHIGRCGKLVQTSQKTYTAICQISDENI